MKSLLRVLRIGVATTVAASTTASIFLMGCAHKVVHPQVCDPVPPPVCDPVPPPNPHDRRTDTQSLLFDTGKAVITTEGKAELDRLCASMKAFPKDTVTLIGHASSDGSKEANAALGLRRAETAKAYLVEQGVAPSRIAARSAGDAEPIVPNDTPANRKLNCRVTFDYTAVE